MKVPEIRFKGFKKKWNVCSVGDFYHFKNGLNKGKEFFGFGTPIVNFTDVFNNRGLTSDILKGRVSLSKKEISSFEVKKGDIFFTRTSETLEEIGYPSVMLDESNDTVFSGFVLRGRALKEDPLSNLFKKYVFFTNDFRKEMISKSSMTTRALTSGTSIKKMEFYFPEDKMEQEKIGIFHSIIDKEIILITTRINLLKQIKAASLQSMFPQEGETIPKVRFKGFEGEWKCCKLGDLGIPVSGIAFPEKEQGGKSGTPFFKVSDMNNEGNDNIMNTANNYVSNSQITHMNWKVNKLLPAIFFAKVGAAVLLNRKRLLLSPCLFDNNTMIFITDSSKLEAYFALCLFRTINLPSLVQIGTLPSYNGKQICSINASIPSYEEQVKIGNFFRNLDHQISLQAQRLEKLKQIKAACLDKMFV